MKNNFGIEPEERLRSAVIRNYISTSGGIHRPVGDGEFAKFRSAYRRYLRAWLSGPRCGRWLDLGCGQGMLMSLAREYGYDPVEGVDLSTEMLATASALGLKVRAADVFSEVENTETESCSVVSLFDLLEHFSKEDGFRLLKGIHRILKPGGTLLLKLPKAYTPFGFGITANDLTHETSYTGATVLQLGRLAGFTAGEVKEVGPQLGSIAGCIRWVGWHIIRIGMRVFDIIETGQARSETYTRVMLVRLQRT